MSANAIASSSRQRKSQSAVEPGLTRGRARRSTAGNRMRALLDSEREKDAAVEEADDDVDFIAKEEEDAFESDFASTDEEANMEEDEDKIERDLAREERWAVKKAGKARKAPSARDRDMAYLKTRIAPKPLQSALDRTPMRRSPPPKKKPRFACEPDVDSPAAGEASSISTPGAGDEGAVEGESAESGAERRRRRASGRTLTVAYRTEVNERAAEDAKKASKLAKKPKALPRARYTQDELIEEALFTEEMNNESLRDWLAKEEARRLSLRVVRKRVEGPRMTWISRDAGRKLVEIISHQTEGEPMPEAGKAGKGKVRETTLSADAPADPASVGGAALESPSKYGSSKGKGRVSRSYIAIDPAPPDWHSEMSIVFGSHVSWREMKVIPIRNRPQTRKLTPCPITGLPAQYLDPRTGIPYANASAYRTLTKLLANKYIWSVCPGGWTGGAAIRGADGVPEGWDDAVLPQSVGGGKRRRGAGDEKVEAVSASASASAISGPEREMTGTRKRLRGSTVGLPSAGSDLV